MTLLKKRRIWPLISQDGASWEPVTEDGFRNPVSHGQGLCIYASGLFIERQRQARRPGGSREHDGGNV
jgi:hypothetical protein